MDNAMDKEIWVAASILPRLTMISEGKWHSERERENSRVRTPKPQENEQNSSSPPRDLAEKRARGTSGSEGRRNQTRAVDTVASPPTAPDPTHICKAQLQAPSLAETRAAAATCDSGSAGRRPSGRHDERIY